MFRLLFTFIFLLPSMAIAGAFQADFNTPRINYIPYHNELKNVYNKVTGVDPATLPAAVSQQAASLPVNNKLSSSSAVLQTIPLSELVVNAYYLFANNSWKNTSTPTTSSSGNFFKTTTTSYLQITGNNSFTGESYDSGKVQIASSSGSTLLGKLLPIVVGAATILILL